MSLNYQILLFFIYFILLIYDLLFVNINLYKSFVVPIIENSSFVQIENLLAVPYNSFLSNRLNLKFSI